MTRNLKSASDLSVGVLLLSIISLPAFAADAASDADKAFIAKVSQGGMFEVALGKVAAGKGSTQAIRDNGVTESHDHDLVGAKLKATAKEAGVEFDADLNAEFKVKLDKISGLSGKPFDEAYVAEMEHIHLVDGGLFAKEAKEGTSALRIFAAETHEIVEMHVGALRATSTKAP
jgi:putative membrane protein